MKHIYCLCGTTHHLSTDQPDEHIYFADSLLREFVQSIVDGVADRNPASTEELYEAVHDHGNAVGDYFYFCITCRRLVVPDPNLPGARFFGPCPDGVASAAQHPTTGTEGWAPMFCLALDDWPTIARRLATVLQVNQHERARWQVLLESTLKPLLNPIRWRDDGRVIEFDRPPVSVQTRYCQQEPLRVH